MRRTFCILPIILATAGCASKPVKSARYAAGQQDVRGAIVQPLADFNLVRDKVPAVLRKAQMAPYVRPEPFSCNAIRYEVTQLDEALGPDADVLDPAPSGRMQQGETRVAKSAVGAVRDLTTGWIPMRNWVRELTGAEQHSATVRKAVNAGMMRRAYLKGLAVSTDCPILATPAPTDFPAPPTSPSSAG